jgi:hypothetical protein
MLKNIILIVYLSYTQFLLKVNCIHIVYNDKIKNGFILKPNLIQFKYGLMSLKDFFDKNLKIVDFTMYLKS